MHWRTLVKQIRTHWIAFLTAILMCHIAQPIFAEEELEFELKEQQNGIMPFDIHATIVLENNQVARAHPFSLQVRVICVQGSVNCYNPFHNRLIEPSARIAIFDSNKRFLGDALAGLSAPRTDPSVRDWVSLRQGDSVGTTIPLRGGWAMPKFGGLKGTELPVGSYFMQMIFRRIYTSSIPAISNPSGNLDPTSVAEWQTNLRGEDAFRSNVISFEVVDPGN